METTRGFTTVVILYIYSCSLPADEVDDDKDCRMKTMTFRGQSSLSVPAPRGRTSPLHPAQPRHSPSPPTKSPQRRRPFPRMDFDSVACLSPLPPSPSFVSINTAILFLFFLGPLWCTPLNVCLYHGRKYAGIYF